MSERSAAEKLQIKPGRKVRLVNAPEGAQALLSGLPAGALVDTTAEAADILILFAHHRSDLERLLPGLGSAITPGGIIWVAYHKGTSPVKTDINRDSIWKYAQTIGMNAVSQVSIDDDWSAMRLKVT